MWFEGLSHFPGSTYQWMLCMQRVISKLKIQDGFLSSTQRIWQRIRWKWFLRLLIRFIKYITCERAARRNSKKEAKHKHHWIFHVFSRESHSAQNSPPCIPLIRVALITRQIKTPAILPRANYTGEIVLTKGGVTTAEVSGRN